MVSSRLEKTEGNAVTHVFRSALSIALFAAVLYSQPLASVYAAVATSDEAQSTSEDLTSSLVRARGLFDMGRVAEAAAVVKAAIDQIGDVPKSREIALAWSLYARALRSSGRAADAVAPLERVIEVLTELDRASPELAQAYVELGHLRFDLRQYPASADAYTKAIEVWSSLRGPESLDVGVTLAALGRTHNQLGDDETAAKTYRRAIDIIAETAGGASPLLIRPLNDLANSLKNLLDLSGAREVLARARTVIDAAGQTETPEEARLLIVQAAVERYSGNYPAAFALYQRAIDIEARTGVDELSRADTAESVAALYSMMGDYGAARSEYTRIRDLRIRRRGLNDFSTARAIFNLGVVGLNSGDFAQAEIDFRQVLSIYEALGAKGAQTSAIQAIAVALNEQRKFEEAHQLLLRVVPKGPLNAEASLSVQDLKTVFLLAVNERSRGEFAAADQRLELLVPAFRRSLGGENQHAVTALIEHVVVRYELNDLAGATSKLREVLDIEERTLRRNLGFGTDSQKRSYVGRLAPSLDAAVSMCIGRSDSSGPICRLALTAALRRKARALDIAADQQSIFKRHLRDMDPSLVQTYLQFRASGAALAARIEASGPEAELVSELTQIDQQTRLLEGKLMAQGAPADLVGVDVTVESVARAIPRGSLLIEYLRYRPLSRAPRDAPESRQRYAAFALEGSGKMHAYDLGEAEAIDQQIMRFREQLADPNLPGIDEASFKLGVKLLGPMRQQIARFPRLYFSPDSSIALVPFAALSLIQERPIILDKVVVLLSSGRDLLRLRGRQYTMKASVEMVIAAPAFDTSSGSPAQTVTAIRARAFDGRWEDLPGARVEARRIADLLKGAAEVLTGAQATEAAIKRVASPRVLHIATHGFFLPKLMSPDGKSELTVENPLLRAGLLFAGANRREGGDGEDGVLTALEATSLDLAGTQLVVLSACDTGLGDVSRGDGVIGLRRAFALAGARAQLASLWKVSDAATQALMVDYYRAILSGADLAAGLRQAQLSLMKRSATRHPFNWAAFVFSGDATSLTGHAPR